MIEIIPNWHPIFVHFTVALFSVSVILFLLTYFLSRTKWKSTIFVSEFEIVARWCLWIAAIFTLATVSFGFYAYYTVKHDAISHIAMTTHRNWAISTAIAIFLMSTWLIWRYVKHKKLNTTFVIALLIVEGLLVSTAWHGAELVYRYGTGVMSLPKAEKIGHQHNENKSNKADQTDLEKSSHQH